MKVNPMDEAALLAELEREQKLPVREYHWPYEYEDDREPTQRS